MLDALASAAARLSGMWPDARPGDVLMAVGIQRADPESPNRRTELRTVASYLAGRSVSVQPWHLDSVDA